MRYGQLPERGNGRGLSIRCVNVECESFGVPFSPDRGDYFYMPDRDPVTCSDCGEGLVLTREHTWTEEVQS